MNKKVSQIEFHIDYKEADDCILRMAELIKEGYTLYAIKRDDPKIFYKTGEVSEPYIHIILRMKEGNYGCLR